MVGPAETADWSAAPQTGVLVTHSAFYVTGGNTGGGIVLVGAVGVNPVVVGCDAVDAVSQSFPYALQGDMLVILSNTISGDYLGTLGIGPGAPFASWRPPFGSVKAGLGEGVTALVYTPNGTAKGGVILTLYYYLVSA